MLWNPTAQVEDRNPSPWTLRILPSLPFTPYTGSTGERGGRFGPMDPGDPFGFFKNANANPYTDGTPWARYALHALVVVVLILALRK